MELFDQLAFLLKQFIDIILHLDVYLNEWAAWMGPWLYVLMFFVIFAETGLVIFPFLPGDSLLFALGALTSVENAALSLPLLMVSLTIAAILGDATNYFIGRYVGPRVFKSDTSRFFNKKHLLKTEGFYKKYGGKTVIFARFLPIFRTFAPFLTGISKMPFPRYITFNILGAVSWICIFLSLGHYFGNLPQVKSNFHLVIIGIIGISLLPAILEILRNRNQNKH